MEMTIDKAIAKIWHCIVSIRDCTGNKEFVEALILSVDIIRKYQKINQILKSLEDGEINYPQMTYYLREVIEDGNDKEG